ncbi:MAG TPA: RodZ domain-containing protein [Thermomicrobiales bacterium]|nr:RodZ domain-containing protein [Thermomicrobiales bacterium]
MSGFGDTLRHARANKGVTLTEVERAIRIPRKYLRALEDEAFDELPEGVYSRGIVRNYAQYLNLDPDDAIAYFEELRGSYSGGFKVVPAVKPMEVPSHWAPNFAAIAFLVVISAVLFAWLYSAFFAAHDAAPTVTPAIATPTEINTTPAVLLLTPTAPPPQPTATTPPPTQAPPTAAPQPTTVPAGQAAAPVPPTQPPAPTPTPPPPPTPTPAPPPPTQPPAPHLHTVTITSDGFAWVQVTVDGAVQFSDAMQTGQTLSFKGKTITIQSGRAQLVHYSVDGVDKGIISSNWNASVTIP